MGRRRSSGRRWEKEEEDWQEERLPSEHQAQHLGVWGLSPAVELDFVRVSGRGCGFKLACFGPSVGDGTSLYHVVSSTRTFLLAAGTSAGGTHLALTSQATSGIHQLSISLGHFDPYNFQAGTLCSRLERTLPPNLTFDIATLVPPDRPKSLNPSNFQMQQKPRPSSFKP